QGGTKLGKIEILGKGTTSIVLMGVRAGSPVAVKVLRTDSGRGSVLHEAEMLSQANQVGVGAKLLGMTGDILALELVEGRPMHQRLGVMAQSGESAQAVWLLSRTVLDQCAALDRIGLDHGQLSRPHKHVYVGEDHAIKIIDFESASTQRIPSNLTSMIQYFIFTSPSRALFRGVLLRTSIEELFGSLRAYKRNPRIGSYREVLSLFGP
ncbi:MAG: hypothetical protein ACE5KH_06695, partial [Candidatus Geothermarchaeales archaeon]